MNPAPVRKESSNVQPYTVMFMVTVRRTTQDTVVPVAQVRDGREGLDR